MAPPKELDFDKHKEYMINGSSNTFFYAEGKLFYYYYDGFEKDLYFVKKNNQGKGRDRLIHSRDKIAEQEILRKVKKLIPKRAKVDVEVISPERANIYIPEEFIPKIIGKSGKRIAEIEENIGISLGVEVIESKPINKAPFEVDIIHTKKQLILELGRDNGRKNFDIQVNGEYLLTATTSKKGEIKIKRGIELSDFIINAIEMGLEITAIQKG